MPSNAISRLGEATDTNRFLYAKLIVPLVAAMPAWMAYGLALAYANIRIRSDRASFEEVVACLDFVFGPRMTPRARNETARDYFRNRACMRVDAIRLTGDGRRLIQSTTIRGEEHLRQALKDGKGALLCSAHYGSVRVGAALLGARGFPVTLVAIWSLPKDRDKDSGRGSMYQYAWKPIEHHFRRANIMAASSMAVAVEVAGVLRQNELVFTLVDNPPLYSRRAVVQDFLGGKAALTSGPTTMAKLAGAPLLMVFVRRTGKWGHLELEIHPPISLAGSDMVAARECVRQVEEAVRSDPSQWELWRMRTLVSLGLYPEDRAREYFRRVGWRWGRMFEPYP
jgi:KDO2-lipid IV(A) lauroyltransferase